MRYLMSIITLCGPSDRWLLVLTVDPGRYSTGRAQKLELARRRDASAPHAAVGDGLIFWDRSQAERSQICSWVALAGLDGQIKAITDFSKGLGECIAPL
jgi:hypothetical protein